MSFHFILLFGENMYSFDAFILQSSHTTFISYTPLQISSEQCCSQAMVFNPQNVGNEPNITHGTFVPIDFNFFNMM